MVKYIKTREQVTMKKCFDYISENNFQIYILYKIIYLMLMSTLRRSYIQTCYIQISDASFFTHYIGTEVNYELVLNYTLLYISKMAFQT